MTVTPGAYAVRVLLAMGGLLMLIVLSPVLLVLLVADALIRWMRS